MDNLQYKYINNSYNPSARNGASYWNIGDRFLYLFGGAENNNIYNDFQYYDLKIKKWIKLDKIDLPEPRFGATFFKYKDRLNKDFLVIMGGFSNDNVTLNDMWIYDLIKNEWSKVSLPDDLKIGAYATFGLYNNEIYIFGGIILEKNRPLLNEKFYQYDFINNKLKIIEVNKSPKFRFNSNHWIYKNYLYISDGLAIDNDNNVYQLNNFWRFNFDTSLWQEIKLSSKNYLPKNSGLIYNHNEFIYILGGIDYNNQIHNYILRINLLDHSYKKIEINSDEFEVRSDSCIWQLSDKIYVFGGLGEEYHLNDMWQLKPSKQFSCFC